MGGLGQLDVSHPAIAEARQGADRVLLVGAVADRLPCTGHDLAEQVVGDRDPSPDGGDQLIPADGAVAVLEQVGQGVEHARLDGEQPVRVIEFPPRRNQAEGAEAVRGCVHSAHEIRASRCSVATGSSRRGEYHFGVGVHGAASIENRRRWPEEVYGLPFVRIDSSCGKNAPIMSSARPSARGAAHWGAGLVPLALRERDACNQSGGFPGRFSTQRT